MKNSNVLRMVKGIFVGGPLITIGSFGLIFSLIKIDEGFGENWLLVAAAMSVAVAFLLAGMWVSGFWGRWGLFVFFAVAPVLLVIDYAVNPLFPAGAIFSALFLSGNLFDKRKDV